jgi:type VI secretion system secreted protein Hcp
MAIYAEWEDFKGSVTTQDFEGMSELSSFQLGVSRNISTASGGSTLRESSNPSVSEASVTKLADAASPELCNYALTGKLDKKVTIHFTTTTEGKVTEFLKHELENVGFSHFHISSGGDLPMESISLNFTKITSTYTPMDPSVSGQNKVVSHDLTKISGSSS